MNVELVNGADSGPLFSLSPENEEDIAFLSQFPANEGVPLKAFRIVRDDEQWLAFRHPRPTESNP